MCARITVDYRRHKSLCVHEWVIHVCGCARVQQRSIVTRAIHHSLSWSIAHTGFIPVYKFPFSWSLYLYSCWDSHQPQSRCGAQTQGSDEKCIDTNITTMAWFAMLAFGNWLTSFLIENWTFFVNTFYYWFSFIYYLQFSWFGCHPGWMFFPLSLFCIMGFSFLQRMHAVLS